MQYVIKVTLLIVLYQPFLSVEEKKDNPNLSFLIVLYNVEYKKKKFKVSRFYCLGDALTTVFSFSVVPNHYPLVDCAEECCPVNGMVIAQVAVVSDVDVPRTDFFQGLEL